MWREYINIKNLIMETPVTYRFVVALSLFMTTESKRFLMYLNLLIMRILELCRSRGES